MIRAFFVDPRWTRRGIGRRLLERCEAEAAAEGFGRLELVAMPSGEALYRACGCEVVERMMCPLPGCEPVAASRMAKPVTAGGPDR